METNYCRRCGGVLTPGSNNEGEYSCANGHKIFANPALAVGIWIFTQTGDILLAIRGDNPAKGKLDTPGGFSDARDMTLEDICIRELKEELNLSPDDYTDFSYVSSHANAYEYEGEVISTMDTFFRTTLVNEAHLRASDDVASFTIKSIDEIDDRLIAFESAKKSLTILKSSL